MASFALYILRCAQNRLYCGYSSDLPQRIHQHIHGTGGCKFTRSFKPTALAAAWELKLEKGEALRLEYQLKQCTKAQKEALLKTPEMLLQLLRRDDLQSACCEPLLPSTLAAIWAECHAPSC